MVPKEEPRSDNGGGQQGSPGASGAGLPAAANGAASEEGGECIISLLDDLDSEGLNDKVESDEEEEWDEEDGSEDESDAEPCAAERPQRAAAAEAAAGVENGLATEAAEAAPLMQWEAYPSLARSAGQEPPGRTSGLQVDARLFCMFLASPRRSQACTGQTAGQSQASSSSSSTSWNYPAASHISALLPLQKHKSYEGIVVQVAVPASTGNVCHKSESRSWKHVSSARQNAAMS